jgi:hypothetical protein
LWLGRHLVVRSAPVREPWATRRFAAVLASALIADQFGDPVEAEGWQWCVVGVAAGVCDLVWFDSEHCFVADDAS